MAVNILGSEVGQYSIATLVRTRNVRKTLIFNAVLSLKNNLTRNHLGFELTACYQCGIRASLEFIYVLVEILQSISVYSVLRYWYFMD